MNLQQTTFGDGQSDALRLKSWQNYGKPTLFNTSRYTRLLNRILRHHNKMLAIYNELIRLDFPLTFGHPNAHSHFVAIRKIKSLIIAQRALPVDDRGHEFTCFLTQVAQKAPRSLCDSLILKYCIAYEKRVQRRTRKACKSAPSRDLPAFEELDQLQAGIIARIENSTEADKL